MNDKTREWIGLKKDFTRKDVFFRIMGILGVVLLYVLAIKGGVTLYNDATICELETYTVNGMQNLTLTLTEVKTYVNHSKGYFDNEFYLDKYQRLGNCTVTLW